MNLPADTHLAYSVFYEAWYATGDVARGRRPNIMVMASAKGTGGGVAWEFEVAEYQLGGPTLRVKMFDDSWAAYIEVAEFFEELASGRVKTLDDVRKVLDGLGAVDETERKDTSRWASD